MNSSVSFIPLGGVGDVTKNMYLYEYQDQILIVDCGLGFADETMLGVDLVLPDISYLLKTRKKIAGMVLTHGHEDHIGALPFVLPQLPTFPILGTPLTAALANEKLKEFGLPPRVQTVSFTEGMQELSDFSLLFIHVTHSVPDTAHLFIKTPVGNFYHGSDFKFDLTPVDGKKTEFHKIVKARQDGIICLMSDCLGAERKGHAPSEKLLSESFEREMKKCLGRFIVTTHSSNISRLNQAIKVAQELNRKVCFIGRSLIKAKEVTQRLGYLQLEKQSEVPIEQLKNFKERELLLLIAGSQGQENSAMSRIANGEHRDIRFTSKDVVIFSADPIPGNETLINALIDTLAKKGVKVLYSEVSNDLHVSGHGSSEDLSQMISLTHPKKLLPIGGAFRQMAAYKTLALGLGYKEKEILLIEDGQEVIFTDGQATLGRKIEVTNVCVDEISGEEVESFVLRDRQRLSKEGLVIVVVEVSAATGQIVSTPQIIMRGFSVSDNRAVNKRLIKELRNNLKRKPGRVVDWIYLRKLIGEISQRSIFRILRRRPLVLPVVIEV